VRIISATCRWTSVWKDKPCLCEELERQVLLSTIVWTNRGATGNDIDNFNSVFGVVNSGNARAVVDAAIESWERVIDEVRFDRSAVTDTFGNALTDSEGVADDVLVIDRSSGASIQDLFRLGGDLDGDADTDLVDLSTLAAHYGAGPGGDTDGDGDTDLVDLSLLAANYALLLS
jgi:hypothetical protein